MTTQALFNVHTNKTTSEMIMFGDSLVDAYYKEIIFRWRENTVSDCRMINHKTDIFFTATING